MRTAATAFILSALSGATLTPWVRAAARRHGVLDHALSSRKIHGKPIPRLGGVAIVAAFYIPLVALLLTNSSVGERFWGDRQLAVGLFAGGLLIAALGLYDDLRGAGARLKFTVQFGVAGLMYAFGYRIDQLAIPFGSVIDLGWFGPLLTVVWIVGIINAMNLIDGLDGLAAGVALLAVGATFVQAASTGHPLMLLYMGALGGAVVGFLIYNFNPATIFMGDTGSMFLGFVLATSAIQTNHKASSTAVAMAMPIIALGFPIADTLLAITRRALRGAPLFSADRDHIHHRLLDMGLSQRQAVLALYAAAGALGLAALGIGRVSGLIAFVCLAILVAIFVGTLRWLGYLRIEAAGELLEQRGRNLEMRRAVREAGERLGAAADVQRVFDCLPAPAAALGASCVGLDLEPRPGMPSVWRCSRGLSERCGKPFCTRFSLQGERGGDGVLELGWPEGTVGIDRDTEISVETLCRCVCDAMDRVRLRPVQTLSHVEAVQGRPRLRRAAP